MSSNIESRYQPLTLMKNNNPIGDAESPIQLFVVNKETKDQPNIVVDDDESLTDESQKSNSDRDEPSVNNQDTVKLKKDGHSKTRSVGRMISNSVKYKIPRSISRTRLKDTIQCGYLLTLIPAIAGCSLVVIGDWITVKLFDINICTIENNTEGINNNVDFMSWNAFGGLIQQLWLIIICLGLFPFIYMPQLVDVEQEHIRNSRITLFGVMISMQVIVNLFLVPFIYNFRSIFNALTLCLFLLWAFYEKRCPGVRAIYPLWAVIFAAVFLYYVVGTVLFKNMTNSMYAVLYPFFLSFCQFTLIKLLEYLDGCKCCKPGIDNQREVDEKSGGSICRTVTKTLEFWRQTSAINTWPKFWVYYACGLVVVMSESFRIASYVVIVKTSVRDLISSFVIGMFSEIITRNMVYKIIWNKYIMKRRKSSRLSAVKAIYLGCRFQTDYIPVIILVTCNILGFGHTYDCYYSKIGYSMDITNGYEWMIAVFIGYELLTDTLTYVLYRVLKKFNILTQDAQDKTIKMAVVMLSRPQMFTMMLSLGYWSFVAFIYDDSARPAEQP
eukprot:205108_1